ncbi:MAG: transporter substrate-binding domain-containing protein [Beijerinckiaceae bacterium]|nr:transporter substrate-binding domain-containing protein [Beijerinckiaceae bacterium]
MTGAALAQQTANTGLLAKLRKQGVARVGIANQPPFSALNPDGTMSGLSPAIARRILERIGVPRMEGAVATYGELVPGMFAGRWDFVAASLTITKERCGQVLFSDPMSFEGPCIVSVSEKNTAKPLTKADLIKMNVTVGVHQGGAQYRELLASGMPPDRIIQFAHEALLFDGLMAGRVQYLWAAHLPTQEIIKRRRAKVDMVFPVADATAPGAGNAFRTQDTDLHAAFQEELRAMKRSGEFLKIAEEHGFEIPADLLHATAEQQCALVSKGS